jgi:aarF domain-containing kinase
MIDMTPQTEEEMQAIRDAVVTSEGLLLSVFDVLRRVPRRVLMVLKLNDLTRCDLFVEPLNALIHG